MSGEIHYLSLDDESAAPIVGSRRIGDKAIEAMNNAVAHQTQVIKAEINAPVESGENEGDKDANSNKQ